nr:hypothetical protein BCV17_20575 [Vibrio cyclitrophicus]
MDGIASVYEDNVDCSVRVLPTLVAIWLNLPRVLSLFDAEPHAINDHGYLKKYRDIVNITIAVKAGKVRESRIAFTL